MSSNLDLLRNLFSYDRWAINRSLSTIGGAKKTDARLMLSHILEAERIWLIRLQGQDTSHLKPFVEYSLEECLTLSDRLHLEYTGFLNSISEENLDLVLEYKNTQGLEFRTSIKDILLHVAVHGAYHRGQIAWLVRDGGGTAVSTDYIGFTRI